MHEFTSNTIRNRINEGFPRQRLVVLPANVIRRCQSLPIVQQLYVTDIGSFPAAPHHYIERPSGAPQAILLYCLAEFGRLEIRGREFSMEPGSLAIIPAHEPHIYYADEEKPWSVFWVHFTGSLIDATLESLGTDAGHPLLHAPDTELMRSAFEDVYACLNYHYSDAGLLAMTAELLRMISRIKLHHTHPRLQTSKDRILSTIHFLESHLDITLTVDELAAQAGQSVPYYTRLFKARTDQSPMAYFIQLKIRKACELFDHTDLSVKAVAEQLGYDDPYYFSRLFKKVQGSSPTAYRQTIKG